MLAPLVYLLAGLRPTSGLQQEPWKLLDSISAYYHTGATAVFVGVIAALALFLFSYRGYKGAIADRVVGIVGGVAAAAVVLFPADPPPGVTAPYWWTHTTGEIHFVAAVGLFLSFIVFSVWLFRKSDTPRRRDRPAEKRHRDDVCLACGVVMIGAVLWAAVAIHSDGNNPIFLPETIAIVAFAISWLAKGQAHQPIVRFVTGWMRGREEPRPSLAP
jgi:heme/copper-type cytochrome/quinol oxidase subunit 2